MLVCDLISNVSFSFEQLNGTLALPVKSRGGYHMFGKVTVSNTNSLHHILSKLVPLFETILCLKIVLPPLPRYLFNPCCTGDEHCDGIGQVGYTEDLLEKTIGLRKVLRDYPYSCVSNVWVPNTVTSFTSNLENLTLDNLFASDGVHLNGTVRLVMLKLFKKLLKKSLLPFLVFQAHRSRTVSSGGVLSRLLAHPSQRTPLHTT